MRRTAAAAVLAVLALPLLQGVAAAGSRSDYEASLGTPADQLHPRALLGHTWVGTGTGIAGEVVMSRGELIVEDRPFDDTGADTLPHNGPPFEAASTAGGLSGSCTSASGYSTGDLSYPSGATFAKNAADLVQVRLAVQGGSVHVLFQLQTLIDGTTTAVQLLVDAHVLTVTASGGRLDGAVVPAAVDLAGNTFEARLPLAVLGTGPWKVNALAGLRSGDGMGSLADLAHVDGEAVESPKACRLDTKQSAELASGVYDRVTVDPRRLVRGDSDPARITRGAFTRNYVPRLKVGEGLAPQTRYAQDSSGSIWGGTVQPYSVYVPKSYNPNRPNPMILLLHCLSCLHTVFDMSSFPGLKRLAESRGAIIATPFGYGEAGWYEGEAEADAFAVLSDVSRRYRIDTERLYLTGMSMGSTGTFRLGLMYPDLWAKLLPVASATVPFCVSPRPEVAGCVRPFNYVSVFPNARDLPVGIVQGTIDEQTPVTSGRYYADLLAGQGDAYRYWEWPSRIHDTRLPGLTSDVTDAWLGNTRVEHSPARVTYVTLPVMASPGESYDRAYWLRGLKVAAGVTEARVDAVSGRGVEHTTRVASGSGTDDAGDWTMRGLDGVPARASGLDALTVTNAGYQAMSVDLRDARLTREEPLRLTVTTDVPLTLTVGAVVLRFPAGNSVRVLPATRAVAAGEVSAPVALAATGADPSWLAGPFLLLGVVGLRRRRAA